MTNDGEVKEVRGPRRNRPSDTLKYVTFDLF